MRHFLLIAALLPSTGLLSTNNPGADKLPEEIICTVSEAVFADPHSGIWKANSFLGHRYHWKIRPDQSYEMLESGDSLPGLVFAAEILEDAAILKLKGQAARYLVSLESNQFLLISESWYSPDDRRVIGGALIEGKCQLSSKAGDLPAQQNAQADAG